MNYCFTPLRTSNNMFTFCHHMSWTMKHSNCKSDCPICLGVLWRGIYKWISARLTLLLNGDLHALFYMMNFQQIIPTFVLLSYDRPCVLSSAVSLSSFVWYSHYITFYFFSKSILSFHNIFTFSAICNLCNVDYTFAYIHWLNFYGSRWRFHRLRLFVQGEHVPHHWSCQPCAHVAPCYHVKPEL